MKRLILIVCSILLGGLIGVAILGYTNRMPEPDKKAPDPKYSLAIGTATVQDTQDFTVLIANESMDQKYRGTGVLLSSTTVLTCAHMIPSDKTTKTLWIYPFPGDRVVHAKLKFINYPNDLALLELSTPVAGHKVPVLAKETLIGEQMLSVGNINGYMMWFASYGIISGEHQRWVLTDAMVRHGNSGGPWVNAKGEIIALTDVGWESDTTVISGGVPVQELRKFLAQANRKKPDLIYALTGE